GRVRHARTQRHHGLGRSLAAEETLVADAPNEPLLEVSGVTKRFGGFTALDNCISGTLRNEEGGIRFEGRDIGKEPAHRRTRLGLARSFQIPKPFASM